MAIHRLRVLAEPCHANEQRAHRESDSVMKFVYFLLGGFVASMAFFAASYLVSDPVWIVMLWIYGFIAVPGSALACVLHEMVSL